MKQINIVDINIKEFAITYTNNEWSISVVYSLVADDGKEYDTKRDMITNADLTKGQKNYLQNILTVLTDKIKTKEGIN